MKTSKASINTNNFCIETYMQSPGQLQRRNSQHSSGYSSLENCVISAETPTLMYYMVGGVVGRGNFSTVRVAEHIFTKMQVAIKVVDKSKLSAHDLGRISREVSILKRIRHQRITKMYQVMETTTKLFIVMEYVPNGEMFEYIRKHGGFPEQVAKEKFSQLLDAVEYCHNQGVVHRDLKLENILLDSNYDVKLADFGFGTYVKNDALLQTFCGSPPYAAPEIFLGVPYQGLKTDIWSLGIILFCMVVGGMPFDDDCLPNLRRQVLAARFRVPYWVSLQCDNLIRIMLRIPPERRPTIPQIRQHTWMKDTNTSKRVLSSGAVTSSSAALYSQNSSLSLSIHTNNSNQSNTNTFPWNLEALQIMEIFGHSKQLINELLQRQTYDNVMAHYLLLCDYLESCGVNDATKLTHLYPATWVPSPSPRAHSQHTHATRFLFNSTDSSSPSPDLLESQFTQLAMCDNSAPSLQQTRINASPIWLHRTVALDSPHQMTTATPVSGFNGTLTDSIANRRVSVNAYQQVPVPSLNLTGNGLELVNGVQHFTPSPCHAANPWQQQSSRLSSINAATPYLQRRMSFALGQESLLGSPLNQQVNSNGIGSMHPTLITPIRPHPPSTVSNYAQARPLFHQQFSQPYTPGNKQCSTEMTGTMISGHPLSVGVPTHRRASDIPGLIQRLNLNSNPPNLHSAYYHQNLHSGAYDMLNSTYPRIDAIWEMNPTQSSSMYRPSIAMGGAPYHMTIPECGRLMEEDQVHDLMDSPNSERQPLSAPPCHDSIAQKSPLSRV